MSFVCFSFDVVNKCGSRGAAHAAKPLQVECQVITETPYWGNKYLSIQQYICINPLLVKQPKILTNQES